MSDADKAGRELLAEMVAAGMSNAKIARQLKIHPNTISRLTATLRGKPRDQPRRPSVDDPRTASTVHYWRPARP